MAPTQKDDRLLGAMLIVFGSLLVGWGVKSSDFVTGGAILGVGLATVILGVLRATRS